MTPSDIKFGTNVYIEWRDSCAALGWQNDVATSVLVKSIGIVVDCNEQDISITHSLMEGERFWNCPISIPWCAVTKIEENGTTGNKGNNGTITSSSNTAKI